MFRKVKNVKVEGGYTLRNANVVMITRRGVDPKMKANNLEPSVPIHPGEMIKEEVGCRGTSQKKLAEQTGIPCTALNEVLNDQRPVSTE